MAKEKKTRHSADARESQNLLEWLSYRGFPDSAKTLVVGLVVALTVSPYMGGKSIWFVGSNPLTIPTISAHLFWKFVFIAPLMWCVLVLRFINASLKKSITILVIGISMSFLVVAGHKIYPEFAIRSINSLDENFDNTYGLNFLDIQHVWTISHEKQKGIDQYCYFITPKIDLGNDVKRGSVLRISRIEIESNGFATIPSRGAAFDLETYVGTTNMLPNATYCVPWSKEFYNKLMAKSFAQVQGKAVIGVDRKNLGSDESVKYSIVYDFEKNTITGSPLLKLNKELSRKNILVGEQGVGIQLIGWTLWGPESCRFRLDDLTIRVIGRLQDGFWF